MPNHREEPRSNPLRDRARAGDWKGAEKILLALGASAANQARDADDRGNSALMWAALRGRLDMIRLLLPFSDPLAANGEGRTALMLAAQNATVECVEALLPASDARARDREGLTALMHAAKRLDPGCALALLPRSDAMALDKQRRSALHHACMGSADRSACVKRLLPHSSVNAQDSAGETALSIAAMRGLATSAGILAQVANARLVSARGHSALMRAVQKGHASLVAILAPVSDHAQRDHERGETAFEMTLSPRHLRLPLTELLAPYAKPAELAAALARHGNVALPACAASLEAHALAEQMGLRRTNGECVEAPRLRKRARSL